MDGPSGDGVAPPSAPAIGVVGGMATDLPWLEKYRPVELQDIVGNADAVARLRGIAQQGNMPNLVISGPPGCGKTTSVMCLARALLSSPNYTMNSSSSFSTGEELMKAAVLELNASDERGIDVVRNSIKMFAQKKVSLPPGRHKIVILDEADNMTEGAQQALRRTMEIYSSTTRFALACNISSKIIEPIQSRCAVLRFTRLSNEEVMERLVYVCEEENVQYTEAGLRAILFTADGDMRQALNNLQSTHSGFGVVTDENVFKVCSQPHPLVIQRIVSACVLGDIDRAQDSLDGLLVDGYSASDIIGTFFKVIKDSDTISEQLKLEFIRETGIIHMRIVAGLQSPVQLSGLLARLCGISIGLEGPARQGLPT